MRTGIQGAIHSSRDFQWYGASLLRQGIDPWQDALQMQNTAAAHFGPPSFLHMLYVLLLPLSKLSFQHAAEVWCAINILLTIATIYLFRNLFRLSTAAATALLFLLWMSAPFRSTLRLGETSILELTLLSIVFCATNSTIRGLALGFSFSDYIFAPVVLSFLWFKHNIRTLTIAAIVAFLAMTLAWTMLGGSVLQVAFEPFSVANLATRSGTADLVTAFEAALAHWAPDLGSGPTLAYGAGLLASGVYGFYLSRRRVSNAAYLTLISTATLFTARHPAHDHVLLLTPLAYSFSQTGKPMRAVALPIIAVFWFTDGLSLAPAWNAFTPTHWIASAAGCCMLAALLAYLTWAIVRREGIPYVNRAPKDRRRAQATETFSAV